MQLGEKHVFCNPDKKSACVQLNKTCSTNFFRFTGRYWRWYGYSSRRNGCSGSMRGSRRNLDRCSRRSRSGNGHSSRVGDGRCNITVFVELVLRAGKQSNEH
jgi:hypothetical protein